MCHKFPRIWALTWDSVEWRSVNRSRRAMGQMLRSRQRLVSGFLSFVVLSWTVGICQSGENRSAPFPAGIAPFLVEMNPDSASSFRSSGQQQQTTTGSLPRWVSGPSGESWRFQQGLTGAWITDSRGRTYRLSRGLTQAWVHGPHGESWRITPRLGGGAWITGPDGKTYSYQPSLLGGGWIRGPDGRSWRITQSLTGTIRVDP
jgi:hypothetical protein